MNDCHMSCGLKNACSTARAPGASRKTAARIPSTTSVLTVETTVPLRAAAEQPGPAPGPRERARGLEFPAAPGGGLPVSATAAQGWMVGNVR